MYLNVNVKDTNVLDQVVYFLYYIISLWYRNKIIMNIFADSTEADPII